MQGELICLWKFKKDSNLIDKIIIATKKFESWEEGALEHFLEDTLNLMQVRRQNAKCQIWGEVGEDIWRSRWRHLRKKVMTCWWGSKVVGCVSRKVRFCLHLQGGGGIKVLKKIHFWTPSLRHKWGIDSTAVSIFEDVLVELTNTVFVNSTNTTTNIEMAVLSISHLSLRRGVQQNGIFLEFCH